MLIQLVAFAAGCHKQLDVYATATDDLLAGPLADFQKETGIKIDEASSSSAADVYLADDANTLALLATEDQLRALPGEVTDLVPRAFKDRERRWVGLTGRARAVAYNKDAVPTDALPATLGELADPRWSGRVGWAPGQASFQSFVAAMVELEGEDKARAWLEAMRENETRTYASSREIVEAIGKGDIDLGLVDHQSLYVVKAADGTDLPVDNHYLEDGASGSFVNVSGAALLASSDRWKEGERLIEYLLGREAQDRFATESFELPLSKNGTHVEYLPGVAELGAPELDRSQLGDLEATVKLLRETKVLGS